MTIKFCRHVHARSRFIREYVLATIRDRTMTRQSIHAETGIHKTPIARALSAMCDEGVLILGTAPGPHNPKGGTIPYTYRKARKTE